MRLVTALVATLLAGLACVPAALAAEVTAQDPSRWVRVRANDGEVNKVTLSHSDGVVTVRDASGALDGDDSCQEIDPTEIRCPITDSEARVWVELGDGDDELTVLGALPVKVDAGTGNDVVTGGDAGDDLRGDDGNDTLQGAAGTDVFDGGEGDDVLLARDALRETVQCGGGQDGGEADLEDDVAPDCETVSKPLPPPGLDEVQPTGEPGPAPAAPPVPVPARSVSASVKRGTVLARVPGVPAYLPVDPAKPLPVGSVVDATDGTLVLTAAADRAGATQTAEFAGGRFVVGQSGGAALTTELRLTGGDFSRCGTASPRGLVARAAGRRVVRKLWGSGKGRFRTRGRNSSATVRGTIWSVEDRCDGTLTRVRRGVVVVENLRTGRKRAVRAGQSVFVRRATPRRRR